MLMLVLLLVMWQTPVVGTSSLSAGKAKLLEDLRERSTFKNKLSPGDDDVIDINFLYQHNQVLVVDEVQQSVFSVGYLNISWMDEDLAWNISDYGGVDVIAVNYDEIWHPAVIVTNTVDPDYLMIDRLESAMIYANGWIMYLTPVYLKTTCNMDVENYPFDSQICHIVFMPFFTDVKFNVTSSPLKEEDDQFRVTGEWKVKDTRIGVEYIRTYSQVQVVRFTMTLERRAMFYVLCVLSPMILTSSIISLVFWIPPSSGEKVSFLVTVFVSLAVFLNFIAETMPRSMSKMPRVTMFLVTVNLQCVVAMIATIFVIRKYEQEQTTIVTSTSDSPSKEFDDPGVKPTVEDETNIQPKPPDLKSRPNGFYGGARKVFRKLTFKRVAPAEEYQEDQNAKESGRNKKWSVRSSTWDMIFFWAFHIISIPCFYLIFAI